MNSLSLAVGCGAGVMALLAGCFGSWGRPSKNSVTAAWVGDPAALAAVDLAQLQIRGVKELFLEAGQLEWSGAMPHVRIAQLSALRGQIPVTLVVSGQWRVTLGESKRAGALLAEELRRLKLDAEARGLFPVGMHLDFDAGGNLTSYAQGLRAARDDLEKPLFLSASIARGWLNDEPVAKVARAVDFSVAFIYGQRPGEPEDTKAWDFQEVQNNLRRVEALKRPYMVGVTMLGSANHLGGRGEPIAWTTEMSLRDLVLNPALRMQGGFTLEGIDREVYGFRAERDTEAGAWRVGRADTVRIVGSGPSYLQSLRKRIAEIATPRHLGELFYRLPLPSERLTPSAGELGDALAAEPAGPDLLLAVEPVERTAQRWVFKVVLENRNDERSEIAMIDNNYVEISTEGGLLGAVQSGAFHRFELLRKGSDKVDIAALRTPERARLYMPVLEGVGRYESGPVEFKVAAKTAQITVSCSFLLPDGRTVTTPPLLWTPDVKKIDVK